MQVKIFLASFLATILAVGVIAAPQELDADEAPPTDVNTDTVFENVASFATSTAAAGPRPTEPTITPKEDDVLAPDTGVVPRDLESLEKRTRGCIRVTTRSRFRGIHARTCSIPNGYCVNLVTWWRYRISSMRPDPFTWCRVYTRPNCSGTRSISFGYPGYGRLGIFNDNIASLECWW